MKRVIVTGGSGFVGANLTRRLINEGHQVHLLLRPGYQPWRLAALDRDVQRHQAPLADADGVKRVIGQIKPDWIFHLATEGAYSWQTDVHQIFQTNIVGLVNLVEACLETGFEAFVNTGSSSEYGFKPEASSETARLEPNSYYAVSKASATLFCRHTAQKYGVHLPTLRLYSVYGPYEAPGRLIPNLILQGLKGKLPPLVNPNIARDYVYVDDVCEAYLLAAAQPERALGAVYNVGSGTQTSLKEIVDLARRVMQLTVEPKWGSMPNRSWDSDVWLSDSRKIRQELAWQPAYSLVEGFQATIEWFQNAPAKVRAAYVENRQGLV